MFSEKEHKKHLKRFRKISKSWTKKMTISKAKAKNTLIKVGLLKKSGKLRKQYR